MELSIIVVNFNTKDITRACLDSIRTCATGVEYEIILVDNASTDGSVEAFKKMKGITLILNTKNLGFAKANNQGIKIAKGNYVLLLNSDTEIREDSIQTMLRFMDGHLKAGVSTCRLDLVTGDMDPAWISNSLGVIYLYDRSGKTISHRPFICRVSFGI